MAGNFQSLAKNKWLRYGLTGLAALFVLSLVFGAGFVVGSTSASPFAPPSSSARINVLRSRHGMIGTIQAIEGQTITVESRDGKIGTVLVTAETQFDKNFAKISFSDLKVNDSIVVLGSPDADGQIKARLIGLVDPARFRFPIKTWQLPSGSK